MATSQHSTVADNPATSILTNSITQEHCPKVNKETLLHVWDREEFELQAELSLTIFNVIFYFISVL